ncbi:MAG: ABC transporter ATP-binding protein/permease [Acholeplasmataceae bacterium]|nr:ABC transporter ATP-binding protein/permease [Acholeplasmataceae bacterium]
MKNNTLCRVLKYLKKDIITLIVTFILSIVTVMLTIYVPILFGKAIDEIIDINNVNIENIQSIMMQVVIVVVATGVLQWIMMTLNNKMTYRISKRLRNECFEKLQVLPLKYLDSHANGETVSIIINDVETFSDGLLLGFTQLFTGVATIIGTIAIMMYYNWIIGLVVVVVTPLSLFVAKFIASRTYKLFKEQSEIRAKQTGFINEMIGNLKVVEAYSHEEDNNVKFDEINDKLEKCSLKAIFYSSLTNPSTRFVNSVVYALVALFGAIFVISPVGSLTLTVGSLTSFLSYANQYTKPFNEISSVITELQNAFACIRRVFNLLDEASEIVTGKEVKLETSLTGKVDINNVYFAYTEHQKLIQNFNLKVKPGERVAIVGPTGCGKTTLINLLMRFYDVNKGSILVDGNDLRDITRHSLRVNYGMVLQDTWIKTASVRDNIAFGKKDATMEEIIEASKKANAHNFIKKLPNGYDTIISDEGNLSVGEKQLLCIARIMLCSPSMLILDEATSSIDTRTEIKIQEAFNTIMKGKTTFIVAHRISTIQEADIILVMNEGNIIEQGNHEELLKLNGFYAKLYNSQFIKY